MVSDAHIEATCRELGFVPEPWQVEVIRRLLAGERVALFGGRRHGRRAVLAAVRRLSNEPNPNRSTS